MVIEKQLQLIYKKKTKNIDKKSYE